MAASVENNKNEERRKRVFVGKLPPDFLRITACRASTSQEQQEAADAQTAMALQQTLINTYSSNILGTLKITVIQAKLVKNYGMTKMDPYARIRVGHNIYETNTDPSGGKNPKWNRTLQCSLPQGINHIYLEIYDECSFTVDELIAWSHITIPQNVFDGHTFEDWFPLSGKQGEGLEGMIYLILSFSPKIYTFYTTPQPLALNVGKGDLCMQTVPVSYTNSYVNSMTSPPPVPPVTLSKEELEQIEEMFPNVDKEVIKSVYEVNKGDKNFTINALLQISESK